MSESNCVTHFACDCITRKIIKYDQLEKENAELKSLFSVQLDMLEQNKKMSAEIEKLQQELELEKSRYYKLDEINCGLNEKLAAEKAKSQRLVEAFRFVEKAETKGAMSVAFYPPLIEKAKAVLAEYKGEG